MRTYRSRSSKPFKFVAYTWSPSLVTWHAIIGGIYLIFYIETLDFSYQRGKVSNTDKELRLRRSLSFPDHISSWSWVYLDKFCGTALSEAIYLLWRNLMNDDSSLYELISTSLSIIQKGVGKASRFIKCSLGETS